MDIIESYVVQKGCKYFGVVEFGENNKTKHSKESRLLPTYYQADQWTKQQVQTQGQYNQMKEKITCRLNH